MAGVARGDGGNALTWHEVVRLRRVLLIGGVAVGLCIAVGFPLLSEFVFNGDWTGANLFALLLTPLFMVMITIAPLSAAFIVYGRRAFLFIVQSSYLLISVGSLGLAVAANNPYLGVGALSGLSVVEVYSHATSSCGTCCVRLSKWLAEFD